MPNMKSILSVIILWIYVCPLESAEMSKKKSFGVLLQEEFQLHPEMTVQDMYKFMYQSAMGPAHWKMDEVSAKKYLVEEIKEIVPDSTEPLMQFLDEDSALVRINLKPFIAKKYNLDSLVSAMVRTTDEFQKSEKILQSRWQIFLELVQNKKLPFSESEARDFWETMKKQNFPAVHHSEMYAKKYHPAYRVILKKCFPIQ